ncbi:MAG: tetratricopeptide repeat protein [Candidatus Marinimicrobia bacterium]|nr:tetratricopeptide repeat protein [Candidatus Neomarinimicrobiota bacterium]
MKSRPLILLLLLISLAFAQHVQIVDNSQVDLRLKYIEAIKLINENQLEKALEIYRFLVEQMPSEPLFYTKYFELLFKTEKYDELERVLPLFIADDPKNEKAKIDLGKLYYLQEDTVMAKSIWKMYLEEAKYSKLFTQHLFHTLLELKQRDQAENILLKSRKINKNNNFFARELADYYSSSGRYGKSAAEYIKYLHEDDTNLSYISDMLVQFPKEDKVFFKVDSVLVREINQSQNLYLHQLRSDFLFSNKKYEDASQEILALEKMTGYPCEAVLEFSSELINTKEYTFAKTFFNRLLQNKNFKTITTEILLNLAKVEEFLINQDSAGSPLNYFLPGNFYFRNNFVYIGEEKTENLNNAFAIYDSLSVTKKELPVGAQALFNIGNLRYTVLRDFDAALENFAQAAQRGKQQTFKFQCFNNQFLTRISKGDLKKADQELEEYKIKYGRNYIKDYYTNRILLDFLNLDFTAVKNAQKNILQFVGFDHDSFNDYFELLTLIENNSDGQDDESQKGLQRFATAELLIRQGKLSEAAEILRYIFEKNPQAKIADESLLRLSQILLQLDYLEEAEKFAHKLIKTESEYREITIKMFGEYYFAANNLDKSKEWYQILLLDFPHSFYLDEARLRLREIRGDKMQ